MRIFSRGPFGRYQSRAPELISYRGYLVYYHCEATNSASLQTIRTLTRVDRIRHEHSGRESKTAVLFADKVHA